MATNVYVRIAPLQQGQPIVDGSGKPAPWFMRALNDAFSNLAGAINAIAAIPEIQAALTELDTATQQAKKAAEAAQSAADNAASANAAQQRETSLQSSYIDPSSVLTATPTTITIAAHTRYYPQPMGDPIAVSVSGGSVAATGPGDVNYVSYSDPERDGGTVVYVVSGTPPTQTGNTHVVGAVEIPTTGSNGGGDGPTRPGFVRPKEAE